MQELGGRDAVLLPIDGVADLLQPHHHGLGDIGGVLDNQHAQADLLPAPSQAGVSLADYHPRQAPISAQGNETREGTCWPRSTLQPRLRSSR